MVTTQTVTAKTKTLTSWYSCCDVIPDCDLLNGQFMFASMKANNRPVMSAFTIALSLSITNLAFIGIQHRNYINLDLSKKGMGYERERAREQETERKREGNNEIEGEREVNSW